MDPDDVPHDKFRDWVDENGYELLEHEDSLVAKGFGGKLEITSPNTGISISYTTPISAVKLEASNSKTTKSSSPPVAEQNTQSTRTNSPSQNE